MEYNPIVEHALQQVWCSPPQDNPTYFTLAKISPINGWFDYFKLHSEMIYLPERKKRYACYQIGQVHPELLSLLPIKNKWVPFSEVMSNNFLMADLYNQLGIVAPKTITYYRWTGKKNILILIKYHKSVPIDLNEDTIHLRMNANYFFHSAQKDVDGIEDYIRVVGGEMTTTAKITELINTYNDAVTNRGLAVRAWVNGYLVKTLSPATVKLNDVAEFVVDTSIKQVLKYKVASLPQFNSELDSKYKYMLKSPLTGTAGRNIEFRDQVDIYIRNPDEKIKTPAVFYNQKQFDALRNLTHVDYSIPVDYVNYYSNSVPGFTNLRNLEIVLYVKWSGVPRPLVFDINRIHELYKMSYTYTNRAMLGIDSTVPYWRAPHLEKANYPKIMGADCCDITVDMVRDAYGYNAIAKLVADSPIKPQETAVNRFNVPYLMQRNSTAYEYDVNGKLIGTYLHRNSRVYFRRNTACVLVEFIFGAGGLPKTFEFYDQPEVTVPEYASFRCYQCDWTIYGKSQNNWEDVTDTGAYSFEDGVVKWAIDPAVKHTMVRLNTGFMSYKSVCSLNTLGYMVHAIPGADHMAEVPWNYVPHQQYDFWLNGHPLIEGIDYIKKDWNVIIFSKDYIVGDGKADQILEVRGEGFSDKNLQQDAPRNTGFVKYGLLSTDKVFHLRDDHVMRIVVGGKLFHRDSLKFRETSSILPGLAPLYNGQPFEVRDMFRPIDKIAQADALTMRKEAIAVDEIISAYLTRRLPERIETATTATPRLYPLYSPMLSAMIRAYERGTFKPWLLMQNYGGQDIEQVAKPFLWMLDFDPTQEANEVDREFAEVHPHAFDHVIDLPIEMVTFLQAVINVYLRNRVSLSHFIRVKPSE